MNMMTESLHVHRHVQAAPRARLHACTHAHMHNLYPVVCLHTRTHAHLPHTFHTQTRQALIRAILHLVNREYEALADDFVALVRAGNVVVCVSFYVCVNASCAYVCVYVCVYLYVYTTVYICIHVYGIRYVYLYVYIRPWEYAAPGGGVMVWEVHA